MCNLLLMMVLAEQVIWFFLCVQIVHPAMASMGHPKKGVSAVQPVNSLPRTAFMEGAAEHQSGEDPTSPVVTCIGQVNQLFIPSHLLLPQLFGEISEHSIEAYIEPSVSLALALLACLCLRVCLLSLVLFFKGQGAMMITTTTTTLTITTIQGVVGMGLVQVLGSYYVALGENFKAKAWEMICKR